MTLLHNWEDHTGLVVVVVHMFHSWVGLVIAFIALVACIKYANNVRAIIVVISW